MAIDHPGDERPKPKPSAHEIGQDLSALSLHELDERAALLEGEVERIRAMRRAKESSREAAGAFFKT